jgi:hypothetical protein
MTETHAFEPELSQPVPRPVRRREAAAGCIVGCVSVFILPHIYIGIFLLVTAILATLSWVGVRWYGVEMNGRVVGKEEYTSRKTQKTTYTLHYAYTVEGSEYLGQTGISAEAYAVLQKGQALPMRVLLWEPKSHAVQLPESSLRGGGLWGNWFGALFWNGILCIFLWMTWVRPWRQRQLVRWGELTSGLVRDVRSIPEKNGVLRYTIRYEYTCLPALNEPEQLYTRSASSTNTIVAEVKVGDVLTVLYDPKRPQRSVPYLFADFEVRTPVIIGAAP